MKLYYFEDFDMIFSEISLDYTINFDFTIRRIQKPCSAASLRLWFQMKYKWILKEFWNMNLRILKIYVSHFKLIFFNEQNLLFFPQ